MTSVLKIHSSKWYTIRHKYRILIQLYWHFNASAPLCHYGNPARLMPFFDLDDCANYHGSQTRWKAAVESEHQEAIDREPQDEVQKQPGQ